MGFIMNDNTAGYVVISVIGLLFLMGCASIICSIFLETYTPYTYKPSKPKQDELIIDADLLEL